MSRSDARSVSHTCLLHHTVPRTLSLSHSPPGISVGSIFGIYEPSETCMVDDEEGGSGMSLEACITNVCQPGKNLLAAGYCLYSSCHTLVLTIGDGVYGFTLDPYVGEFVLTHNRIQVRAQRLPQRRLQQASLCVRRLPARAGRQAGRPHSAPCSRARRPRSRFCCHMTTM